MTSEVPSPSGLRSVSLPPMASTRSNAGIGQVLFMTEGTVEKHMRSILMKLQLPETAEAHRRVLCGTCLPGQPLTERLLLAAMRAMALAGRMVE